MKFTFIAIILFLVWSQASFSACSKEDVQFYLDKGFSQEQITQLCAESGGASVPDYQPYQQKVIIYSSEEAPGIKDGFTLEERKAIKDIKLGADVVGLTVDQNYLRYTSKICVAMQEGKDYDQRFKTCPDVDFEIAREGLNVKASGKKFGLFGQLAVEVAGNIKRTPKVDFEDYPVRFRQQLKRNYDWKARKQSVNFPLRGDFSVTRMANALNTLSKEGDTNAIVAQNSEEEFEEPKRASEEKPKKEKRWWNPFD